MTFFSPELAGESLCFKYSSHQADVISRQKRRVRTVPLNAMPENSAFTFFFCICYFVTGFKNSLFILSILINLFLLQNMGTLNVQYWKKEYILEVYLNSVGSKLLVFTLLISLCLELLKSRKGHVGIGYEKSDLDNQRRRNIFP